MSVSKKKSSSTRSKNRRAHRALVPKKKIVCSKCGKLKLPHRVCPSCGSYQGREVIKLKIKTKKNKS